MATVGQDVAAAKAKIEADLAAARAAADSVKTKAEADVAAAEAAVKAKEGELAQLETHAQAVASWLDTEWDALKAFLGFHAKVTASMPADPAPAAPAPDAAAPAVPAAGDAKV